MQLKPLNVEKPLLWCPMEFEVTPLDTIEMMTIVFVQAPLDTIVMVSMVSNGIWRNTMGIIQTISMVPNGAWTNPIETTEMIYMVLNGITSNTIERHRNGFYGTQWCLCCLFNQHWAPLGTI